MCTKYSFRLSQCCDHALRDVATAQCYSALRIVAAPGAGLLHKWCVRACVCCVRAFRKPLRCSVCRPAFGPADLARGREEMSLVPVCRHCACLGIRSAFSTVHAPARWLPAPGSRRLLAEASVAAPAPSAAIAESGDSEDVNLTATGDGHVVTRLDGLAFRKKRREAVVAPWSFFRQGVDSAIQVSYVGESWDRTWIPR